MYNTQTTEAQNQQKTFGCGRGPGSKFGGPFSGKFGGPFGGKAPWMKNGFGPKFGNRKAANIEETENEFTIWLYAAGLQKSNFNVSVTDDVLSIVYTAPEAADTTKYSHVEYQPSSFSRSFQLNGKVLSNNITASYTDGVLKVTLPKNPDTNKPAQTVEVG